jgi:ZIP family zinc transporter
MTGGEGFAKVMPAAFGFPWCLIYFGIDKVLPIFISILKLAKGSNHHGNEPPCWFRQLHCITFRRIGCWSSFGGVAAGIPEASIAGAVTLAIGIQNFPEGIAVSMPLRRMGMSRWKSFMYGQSSALVEPIAAVLGAFAVTFSHQFYPMLWLLRQVP